MDDLSTGPHISRHPPYAADFAEAEALAESYTFRRESIRDNAINLNPSKLKEAEPETMLQTASAVLHLSLVSLFARSALGFIAALKFYFRADLPEKATV